MYQNLFMVLSTHKELLFKGSKKQHQILAQTAYYQAGKIVIQTILPEQPPVALITLNTLGTTCSTSADTYIPIENISNTQNCSFLESRLVSLYGGKAASLLIEYQQRLFLRRDLLSLQSKAKLRVKATSLLRSPASPSSSYPAAPLKLIPFLPLQSTDGSQKTQSVRALQRKDSKEFISVEQTLQRVANLRKLGVKSRVLDDGLGEAKRNPSEFTFLQNKKLRARDLPSDAKQSYLVKTCFAGIGNNIFQSTLGNVETRIATHLARIMVNYWNFYSLNKTVGYWASNPYFRFKTYDSFPKVHQLNNLNINSANNTKLVNNRFLLTSRPFIGFPSDAKQGETVSFEETLALRLKERTQSTENPSYASLSASYPSTFEQSKLRKANFLGYKAPTTQALSLLRTIFLQRVASKSFAIPKDCAAPPASQALRVLGSPSKAKGFPSDAKQEETYKFISAESEYNVKVWGIKLKVKDKTPKKNIINTIEKNLHFAITQSKNSLKICENKNTSYSIRRLSVENIGDYSQFNNNNFQLINSLQFSSLQRDRFYPNWFRLYLPDIEATEFLKNVANYYFSLGLQTLTLPSTKSYSQLLTSYVQSEEGLALRPFVGFPCFASEGKDAKQEETVAEPALALQRTENTECRKVKHLPSSALFRRSAIHDVSLRKRGSKAEEYKASPFLTFLNKKMQTLRYPKNFYSTSALEPTLSEAKLRTDPPATQTPSGSKLRKPKGIALQNWLRGTGLLCFPSDARRFTTKNRQGKNGACEADELFIPNITSYSELLPSSEASESKVPSFTKIVKDEPNLLNVPFSLLLENQIFPLNYNGFSIVEKELLYDALVNNCFAKAFYLINQNRQLLDFWVDYLLRFQILRQHQILYLFSTLLVSYNKKKAT